MAASIRNASSVRRMMKIRTKIQTTTVSIMTTEPLNVTVESFTENVTPREKHPYTSIGMIFTSIPVGFIIFVIVFGNALVIIAVLRDSNLKRQAQNWLIVSLAFADLLVGLLIMPLTLKYELWDEWLLGGFLCQLWLALDVLFVTASILNLCAISLDRFGSLTYPTRYPQTRTPGRMFVMIIVVWMSAFAISFPPLVGWRPENGSDDDCVLSDQLGYVLYSAFGSFYIPVIVLLFVYARIYCISRKRKKKTSVTSSTSAASPKLTFVERVRRFFSRRKLSTSNPNNDRTIKHIGSKEDLLSLQGPVEPKSPVAILENDYAAVIARVRTLATLKDGSSCDQNGVDHNVSVDPDTISTEGLSHVMAIAAAAAAHSRQEHLPESLSAKAYDVQKQLRQRRKLVRKRERQANVVLGFVLGSFVVSWMPFFCSYLLSAVCCKPPELVFDIIFWMGYCNSALNPFIYNYCNRDFRRAFRRILCGVLNRRFKSTPFTPVKRQSRQGVSNTTPRLDSKLERRASRLIRHATIFSSLDKDDTIFDE